MSKEVKKKNKKSISYNILDLEKAVKAVNKGKSLRSTSKEYKIPYTTLQTRIQGKYAIDVKRGPPSIFSENEEKQLVKWFFAASECGFPVTKDHLLNTAQKIVLETKRVTPFKNGRPGKAWFTSFLRRNPEISQRISQNLTHMRANVTEKSVKSWFAEVKTHFESKNLMGIGPERIFNIDESGFLLNPKSKRVLVRKGEKAVYTVCGHEKECYTALIGGNAAGQLLPTMIVYNYERIPSLVAEFFPDEFVIGKSDTGWMTSETFYTYIATTFYNWCKSNDIEFPVVLFVDGHKSHLTMALSDFCFNNKIELIALFPNATHIMQPMDVALFHPLKEAYKAKLHEWRINNDGKFLTKIHFPSVLKEALYSLDIKNIFNNGFKRCGLYPLSADAINYEKLIQDSETIDTTSKEENCNKNIKSNLYSEENSFFELNIDSDILKEFKDHDHKKDWTGQTEYKELYNFWLKCQKNIVTSMSMQDSNLTKDDYQNKEYSIEDLDIIIAKDNEKFINKNEMIHSNKLNDFVLVKELVFKNENTNEELASEYDLCEMDVLYENSIINIGNDDCQVIPAIDSNSKMMITNDETIIEDSEMSHNKMYSINNNPITDVSSTICKISVNTNLKMTTSCNDISTNIINDRKSFCEQNNDSNKDVVSEQPLDLCINNKFKFKNSLSTLDLRKDVVDKKNINYEEIPEEPMDTNDLGFHAKNGMKTSQENSKAVLTEQNANIIGTHNSKERIDSMVNKRIIPEQAFSSYLFLPKMNKNKKKENKKQRLPFVATGVEWRTFHKLKEEKKDYDEKKKATSKEHKLRNLKIKKEFEFDLKKIKSEKQNIQVHLKDSDTKRKQLKAELRLFQLQSTSEHSKENKIALQNKILECQEKINIEEKNKKDFQQLKNNIILKEKQMREMYHIDSNPKKLIKI